MIRKHRASSRAKAFSRFNCVSVEYQLTTSLQKFKLREFKEEVAGATGESFDERTSIVGGTPTHNPRTADYHIHFRIRWPGQTLRASIEYVKGTRELRPGDKGPFTEEFMAWLGRFFKNETANSDVSAVFTYPTKGSQLALPLPMRLPVGGQEVQVFGMAVGISGKPAGAYAAFVTSGNGDVMVSVDSERTVNFKDFSLHRDLLALSSVARMFAREMPR